MSKKNKVNTLSTDREEIKKINIKRAKIILSKIDKFEEEKNVQIKKLNEEREQIAKDLEYYGIDINRLEKDKSENEGKPKRKYTKKAKTTESTNDFDATVFPV